jgi:hypothetical protein
VGVKNIKANACCVNTISGGKGVGVNLGRRISSITSGASPYIMDGSWNAKNATPSNDNHITLLTNFFFTLFQPPADCLVEAFP